MAQTIASLLSADQRSKLNLMLKSHPDTKRENRHKARIYRRELVNRGIIKEN